MIEVKEITEDDMNTLTSDDELKKAKQTVRKCKNDYYIKAAKKGSNYEFVNYVYIPEGFECEWCGNTSGPPKHGYVIEHMETGDRKLIGSVCIDKVTTLGGAYRKFDKMKKKIQKLQELKDMERNELVDEVMKSTGDKKKVMIELQEIEEQIEEEKEQRKKKLREYKEKKRNQRKKKVEEQDEWLDDNRLKELEGNSDFVDDVLEQHEKEKVLSDKQKEALMNVKNKVEDKFGSVDNWKELKDNEEDIIEAIKEMNKKRAIGYPKHREFIDSVLRQYRTSRYYPALTEKQLNYAEGILEHYGWKDW